MYKANMNDKVTDPFLLNGNWSDRAARHSTLFLPYHNNELVRVIVNECLSVFIRIFRLRNPKSREPKNITLLRKQSPYLCML